MTKRGLSVEERLLANLTKDDETRCWIWGKPEYKNRYPRIKIGDDIPVAHRVAYEVWIGPIPEGYDIGHKCHDEAAALGLCAGGDFCIHHLCCNPEHLKAEPHGANLLSSPLTAAARNAAKTHCKRGHEFTPENTGVKGGCRFCRTCGRMTKEQRAEWDKNHV